MAKPYLEDMDFAFFVVNFGYTKKDYLALTPREKAFIYKAYENKTISTSTMIREQYSMQRAIYIVKRAVRSVSCGKRNSKKRTRSLFSRT